LLFQFACIRHFAFLFRGLERDSGEQFERQNNWIFVSANGWARDRSEYLTGLNLRETEHRLEFSSLRNAKGIQILFQSRKRFDAFANRGHGETNIKPFAKVQIPIKDIFSAWRATRTDLK
jgi:hypothetical protein